MPNKTIMYMSPIFRAGDFENTAQIEADYRKLEKIKQIYNPKGTVSKVQPRDRYQGQ